MARNSSSHRADGEAGGEKLSRPRSLPQSHSSSVWPLYFIGKGCSHLANPLSCFSLFSNRLRWLALTTTSFLPYPIKHHTHTHTTKKQTKSREISKRYGSRQSQSASWMLPHRSFSSISGTQRRPQGRAPRRAKLTVRARPGARDGPGSLSCPPPSLRAGQAPGCQRLGEGSRLRLLLGHKTQLRAPQRPAGRPAPPPEGKLR